MRNKFKLLINLSVLLFAGLLVAYSQGMKTEKFKVGGNCESCKIRIEKAAKSVDGVNKASWDINSRVLEITFNPSKTSLDNIEKAIAAVGHDTPLHKAPDKVYKNLPECCQYDRK
jgi:periplasmic mercuric ion binding protein